jgi:RNA polymerase sigma-70 factor (ECF subfamily)
MASGQLGSLVDYLQQILPPRQDDGLTDRVLLTRFVERHEESAFAALVQRHGPMVLGVCGRVLHEPHDAEDAFQATFLVLARRAASIRKQQSVGSWLYGVAYRVALKARTGAARRRARERQAGTMARADAGGAAAWQELRPVLDAELNGLPEKYRAPLVLCYLEGKTNAEAARQLGWTRGTVSGRLARARDLLRGRLTRRGLTLAPALLATALCQEAASAAVPAALVVSTVKAATVVGTGQAVAAAAASARVATLAEGVLRAMCLTKWKVIAVVLVALGVLGTGGGLITGGLLTDGVAAADSPPARPARGAAKARTDQERIQGTWVVVSGRHSGREMPKDDVGRYHLRFAGNRMTFLPADGRDWRGEATFHLEPKRSPREIEFPTQDFDNHRQGGIYKLDGDTLTLCLRDADKGPPTEFAADAGSRQLLLVLRREQRGAGKGADEPKDLKKENERLQEELQKARDALEVAKRQLEELRAEAREARARAAEREAEARAVQRFLGQGVEAPTRKAGQAGDLARAGNNLKELALAMHAYLDTQKHFPPAAIYGPDGRPVLSWRVALLPYLGQQELYRQFKLDEPWDSPHNRKLLDKMPAVFAPVHGKAQEVGRTYYQVFTGKGTVFEGTRGVGIADIPDGTANTLLIVEAASAVPWTKPADLRYQEGKPLPKLGGQFPGGFLAALADGSFQFLRSDIDPRQVRLMILRNDGQLVDPRALTVRP